MSIVPVGGALRASEVHEEFATWLAEISPRLAAEYSQMQQVRAWPAPFRRLAVDHVRRAVRRLTIVPGASFIRRITPVAVPREEEVPRLLDWLACVVRNKPWSTCPWEMPTVSEEDPNPFADIVEMNEDQLRHDTLQRWGPVLPRDVSACKEREDHLQHLLSICQSQGPECWNSDEENLHRWIPEEVLHSIQRLSTPEDAGTAAMFDLRTNGSTLAAVLGWGTATSTKTMHPKRKKNNG